MTRRQIQAHSERIDGVMRKAYDQHGWVPVEDMTPAEIMMSEEPEWDELHGAPREAYDYPSEEVPDLQLRALKMEEALEVARWARRRQMEWLLSGGPQPFRIVQRFYGLAWMFYRDLLGPFNGAMIAEMMGQGRAAFSACIKALFSGESLRSVGVVVKVAGQKSAESAAKYAANARKHLPKRRLCDHAGEDDAVTEGLEAERSAAVEARRRALPEMRRRAEQMRLAALVGCDPDEIDPDKTQPKHDE